MAIPTGNILKQLRSGSLRNNLGVVKKLSGLLKGDKRLTRREIEKNIRTINKADKELATDEITSSNQRLTSIDRKTVRNTLETFGAGDKDKVEKPGSFAYHRNIKPTITNDTKQKPAKNTAFYHRSGDVVVRTTNKERSHEIYGSASQAAKASSASNQEAKADPYNPTNPPSLPNDMQI